MGTEYLAISKRGNDVKVCSTGSLFVFYLHTDGAKEWAQANVEIPDHMWLGNNIAFACEHGYAKEIAFAMLDAGLAVE